MKKVVLKFGNMCIFDMYSVYALEDSQIVSMRNFLLLMNELLPDRSFLH